jgi:hypothetical protein
MEISTPWRLNGLEIFNPWSLEGLEILTPWSLEGLEISGYRRKKSKTFRLRKVSSPPMESCLQVPHGRFSKVAYVTSLTAFPKSDIFGIPPLQALKLDPCSTVCWAKSDTNSLQRKRKIY